MRIVDRVPAGVAIVRGPELRFTLVNTAYAAIPATPGRMVGRTVAEVFPTMPASALALLEKVYTTGETLSLRGIRLKPTWGAARLSGTWTSSHFRKPGLTAVGRWTRAC
jgi:hypothetical protein